MERESYMPLAQSAIGTGRCQVADAAKARRVTAASPAIDVMTDLRTVAAATIEPDIPLAEANQAMILRGVRSLFVVDRDRAMLGLVTATDLLGEKPVLTAAQRGLRPADLSIRDVMVAADRLEAVDMADVVRAEVGHIVSTLKQCGRQHLMVIEHDQNGTPTVRGIFSSSQIARQLGIPMPPGAIATTFAEIEAALAV